jgi:RHS repeat-associated protein
MQDQLIGALAEVHSKNPKQYGLSGITYDKNGNIKTLTRQGKTGISYGTVDQLTYTYTGNRLMKVEDAISGDHGVDFINKNSGSNDYSYYGDGCLQQDLNEGISQIDYDLYVGKPKQVTLSSGEWIRYRYAGPGALIRRELSSGEVWDYVGGLLLKNGQPYHLATADGTSILEDTIWRPVFEYRDQVGNLRVAFTEREGSLQKTQTSAYEPFGVGFLQRNLSPVKDPYRYHGHEDTPDFGLRLTLAGARCYNQTIGRFLAHDSYSSVAPNWTGYRFAFDNPANVTDPTGNYEITDHYRVLGEEQTGEQIEPQKAGDDPIDVLYTDGYGLYSSRGATGALLLSGVYPNAQPGPGPGDPILPGHPLFGLIDSRQDDLGNWHYYKRGTNEEIHTSERGLDYLFNQAHAFLPNAVAAITKWLNAWRAGRAGKMGLGANPFKGKTFSQIDEMFKFKGFKTKGIDPLNGKGSYFNPETGIRYYLDKGGRYKKGFEGPHVDIWYNGHPSFEKVKYFLDGSPKMYTPLR